MKKSGEWEITPIQPYMAFQTSNFITMQESRYGVSHFYEFSLEKNRERAVRAVPDGTVDLLFGDALTERLAACHTLQQRAEAFMNCYGSLYQHSERFDGSRGLEGYVRQKIYREHGCVSINELSRDTGYSACYIRRIFRAVHGISPKVFEQFVRFQYLLHMLEKNGEQVNMEQAAVLCGYYDQPHMIKEFRRFMGTTPEVFVRLLQRGKGDE